MQLDSQRFRLNISTTKLRCLFRYATCMRPRQRFGAAAAAAVAAASAAAVTLSKFHDFVLRFVTVCFTYACRVYLRIPLQLGIILYFPILELSDNAYLHPPPISHSSLSAAAPLRVVNRLKSRNASREYASTLDMYVGTSRILIA